MKRRANNEGSLFKRADGRWCAYVTMADGRRLYKYGKTKAPLVEWLASQRTTTQQQLLGDAQRITVGEYLARWLDIATRGLAPSTSRQYRGTVRIHVLPTLADMKLAKLRTDHLQTLYVTLEDSGVGIETIHVVQAVLSKAFTQAVKWKLLSTSPTSGVDMPGRKRLRTVTPFTLDQARTFLEAIDGHRLEALFALALATGMRHAELLGLRWEDVDWQTSTVHIRRQYTKDGYVTPKTQRSIRALPIGADTLAVLRRHYERQQFEKRGCVVVFPGRSLAPMSEAFVRREFQKVLAAAGLPPIRFHDLRHTCATLMLLSGVNIKVVQERLGHTKISMTLDTYGHVLPGQQAEAANHYDALLRRTSQ